MKPGRKLGTKNLSSLRIKKMKELFIENYSKTLHISNSCKAAGYSRPTHYTYYENDMIYREKIDEAKEAFIDGVEDELYKLISKGQFSAIQYFLKSKGKSRGWADDTMTIKSEEPIHINYVVPDVETRDLMVDIENKLKSNE